MDDVPDGRVVLRLVDYISGDELACLATVAVPRRDEFIRLKGAMHTVFDVEHEFLPVGKSFIHGVTVRISTCGFQPPPR